MKYKIVIDSKAKEWIMKKGKALTIESVHFPNCCVPIVELSFVYGKPADKEKFEKIMTEGLEFYIEKGLNFKNSEIKIGLTGFYLFKTLRVEGLQRII